MEVTFTDLKEKEIVNVYDGKKLGRIIDIIFDNTNGAVRGIVVPGDKKLFRKGDDIFVPLGNIKRIGDDVILVSLQARGNMMYYEGRTGREAPREVGNAYSEYTYKQPDKKTRPAPYSQNFSQPQPSYSDQTHSEKNAPKGSYLRYRPLSSDKYK